MVLSGHAGLSAGGLNAAADAEFRLTGYVTEAGTLHAGVLQRKPGMHPLRRRGGGKPGHIATTRSPR